MSSFLIDPFIEFEFLRRALLGAIVLSLSSAPIGVFLMLRRMSLMGDAISHSVMPGVAVAYLMWGLSLPLMAAGGFVAGLIVSLLSTYVTKNTMLKEDSSFVSFYLIALSLGTILVSLKGSPADLNHILFGNILGIDHSSIVIICSITTVTLLILAYFYRHIVIECFDSKYLDSIGKKSAMINGIFMGLVVLNMVAAFQAMGTLMSLGLMLLPAISSQFWCKTLSRMFMLSIIFSVISVWAGLLLSFYWNIPSGPSIIIITSVFFMTSLAIGTRGSIRKWAKS
jgi:zinc/manganese transport system permease protein